MKNKPLFRRYIGIDYSGAETPTSSLKGLRIFMADRESLPNEVLPPPSPRKYWTRKGMAHWLVERLAEDTPTLVGMDHGFSFPWRYFEVHHLLPDWPTLMGISGNSSIRHSCPLKRRSPEWKVGF